MALINCVECNKEISDKAESCVHCGAPVNLSIAAHQEIPEKAHKDNVVDIGAWYMKGFISKAFSILFMMIFVIWAWSVGIDTIGFIQGKYSGAVSLISSWVFFLTFAILFFTIPKIIKSSKSGAHKIISALFVLFNLFIPILIWSVIATYGDIFVIDLFIYLGIWAAGDVVLYILLRSIK